MADAMMDPATTPGMAPPAGQVSDFNAPYNSLQTGTVIAFGITYFIATSFLGLRYFQAFKLTKKVEIDLGTIQHFAWDSVRHLYLDSHYHNFLWLGSALLHHDGQL
jgi:hypothetical protein